MNRRAGSVLQSCSATVGRILELSANVHLTLCNYVRTQYQPKATACVQMPEGNAEEPVTLLSSDEDEPAQPVGRPNDTGAGAHIQLLVVLL